jgi:hypothetical protein
VARRQERLIDIAAGVGLILLAPLFGIGIAIMAVLTLLGITKRVW